MSCSTDTCSLSQLSLFVDIGRTCNNYLSFLEQTVNVCFAVLNTVTDSWVKSSEIHVLQCVSLLQWFKAEASLITLMT